MITPPASCPFPKGKALEEVAALKPDDPLRTYVLDEVYPYCRGVREMTK